jgi:hypothetical protein
MIVEIYRKDENNPGDLFSNPARYFFKSEEIKSIDVDKLQYPLWNLQDAIIIGGGGLIGNPNFDKLVERVTIHPDEFFLNQILNLNIKGVSGENKKLMFEWKSHIQEYTNKLIPDLDRKIGPRVLWGVGFNAKDDIVSGYDIDWPEYLNKFHLVGIRDWNSGYTWVPCVSCMHPGFDKTYEITNKVVWYEHKKRLIDPKVFDKYPAPRMINCGQNMDQILEFLGSAEIVVTNSYHGVYWATLLNRKVICIPWGSKFKTFKHAPTLASEKNWADLFDETISYPNALTECRIANLEFFNKVESLMSDLA